MSKTPDPNDGLVKIVFDVPNVDGSVYKTESLWAEPLTDNCYRLRNVPFLVFGYSEQDIVKTMPISGKLVVTGVASRGGHSTYRLILPEDTTEGQFLSDWVRLKELGCTYERATRRLVAVDVPPHADIHAVYRALEDGEDASQWTFEEAHCGYLEKRTT